jgi:hypothetical protein
MSKSYRLPTQIGVDRQINIELEQDFEQIEILSLKVRSEEVYTRMCADYGVVVGRVFSNGGYGIPNARVSIFVPITEEDLNNEIIRDLYPYSRVEDVNSDGYRYNLLPYEQSHQGHTPTGTFPSKEDILTNPALIQVYDKYYKYTVKTNGSGDFMIMGVPIGTHTLVMDLDLSDMGPFSMGPQDLIRIGRANADQFNGADFQSSPDLTTLPQIVSLSQSIEVSPFWGQPEVCQIAIVRHDFNLGQVGVSIQPTALFMGSLVSNIDDRAIASGCRPPTEMGDLCNLITNEGEIIAIRQTIFQDSDGLPILEAANFDQGGKVIDEDGTWLLEIPMNLDYVTTNEFGEQVLSQDPSVGVPTKGKYRFKIKYGQSPSLELNETRRAYFLVPNIKEYGWVNSNDDPFFDLSTNTNDYKKLIGSYYFGLDWSGYTNSQDAIECKDTFYEFMYNKVYTVSGLVDQYFKGLSRGNFIGIKEITDPGCASDNNKFPATDGVRNFDLLFFVVNFFIVLLTPVVVALIPILSFIAQFWPIARFVFAVFIPAWLGFLVAINFAYAVNAAFPAPMWGLIVLYVLTAARYLLLQQLYIKFISPLLIDFNFRQFKLPMLSYPDCDACDCPIEELGLQYTNNINLFGGGSVSEQQIGDYTVYNRQSTSILFPGNAGGTWSNLNGDPSSTEPVGVDPDLYPYGSNQNRQNKFAADISGFRWALAGFPLGYAPPGQRLVGTPMTKVFSVNSLFFNADTTLSQSLNLANIRERYFEESNIVQTTVSTNGYLSQPFTDNLLVLLVQPSSQLPAGTLLTFTDPDTIVDINLSSTTINQFGNFSITGTTQQGVVTQSVSYIKTDGTTGTSTIYLSGNTTEDFYRQKGGMEYLQVITGLTLSNINTLVSSGNSLLRKYFLDKQQTITYRQSDGVITTVTLNSLDSIGSQYDDYQIVFLNRGVDPFTAQQTISYDLSKIFGYTLGSNTVSVVGQYFMNIPIQPNSGSGTWYTNFKTPESHQTAYSVSSLYHAPYNFTVKNSEFQPIISDTIRFYSSLDKSQLSYIPYLGDKPLSHFMNGNYNSGGSLSDDGNIHQKFRFFSPEYQGVIEGGSFMGLDGYDSSGTYDARLYTPTYPNLLSVSIVFDNVENNPKLLIRSDRLPTSDTTQVPDNSNNSFALFQNDNFSFYFIESLGANVEAFVVSGQFGLGEISESSDTDNNLDRVISSFGCSGMVPLPCYTTDSEGRLTVLTPCPDNENPVRVADGCYNFLAPDSNGSYLKTIPSSVQNYLEWSQRFRVTFAFCRGVFSHVFVNSWVNGTLYAFPFKNRPSFDSNGDLKVRNVVSIGGVPVSVNYTFCADTMVFDEETNNFYYRSSPWNSTTNTFIGKKAPDKTGGGIIPGINFEPLNEYNLLFPTTIMDLGPKYIWTKDVIKTPDYYGYQMDNMNTSTWNEITNLVQIFTVSRLVNITFIQSIFSTGNAALASFFSRNKERVDGDYAQMLQINSQYGVEPFNEGNYVDDPTNPADNPIYISSDTSGNPVFGIFYNSFPDQRDLISPRRINRNDSGPILLADYLGTKSQFVPFYNWQNKAYSPPSATSQPSIFGNDQNSWLTTYSANRGQNIYSQQYQSLDRLNSPYFLGNNGMIENRLGYIFQRNADGDYISDNLGGNNFSTLTSAPWYFYFGLKVGSSAMDKFKQKYLGVEE